MEGSAKDSHQGGHPEKADTQIYRESQNRQFTQGTKTRMVGKHKSTESEYDGEHGTGDGGEAPGESETDIAPCTQPNNHVKAPGDTDTQQKRNHDDV